jgi:hypothetical protein
MLVLRVKVAAAVVDLDFLVWVEALVVLVL